MPRSSNHTLLMLGGPPRSGTTYFSSLLDGHSQINWFPDEGFFFEHLHELGKSNHARFVAAAKADTKGFLEGMRDRQLFPLTPAPLPDFPSLKYHWSEAAFRKNVKLSGVKTVRDLWDVISKAYLAGLGYQDRRFICMKAADYCKSVAGALEVFEEARGILIVRDPLASLNSLKRYREKRGAKMLTWPTLVRAIADMNRIPQLLRSMDPKRVRVVRYEDLIEDAAPALKPICDWLGIPMEAACTRPTMMGVEWTNNSSFDLPPGVNAGRARRPDLFSGPLKAYIQSATTPFRQAFGY